MHDARRYDDVPVEERKKLNLLNDDEIPQGAGIGNNDHRERY
jgi:hypothetical protein